MTDVRRLRRLRGVLVAATLALGLAACAEIPTSGPIEEGDQVRASVDDPIIRLLPRPPASGLDPEALVSGFLAASASFEDDHAVARLYLTPTEAQRWDPEEGVVIYDDGPGLAISRQENRVDVEATEVSRIGVDGSLSTRSGQRVTFRFRVERVGEEWRISKAPDLLLLTQRDVDRTYRSYSVYFLAPDQDRLVPDPVFVPVGRSGPATSLVRSLLDGPTRWLAPSVTTAVPLGTELVVDSIPVENGIALVDLSGAVLDATEGDRNRLSAQVVWTLTELPEVTGVRITVDGSPWQLPDAPAVQSEQTWAEFDPNGLPESAAAVLVRGGVVRRVEGDGSVPLSGPLGQGAVVARHPATSADGALVAALTDGGTRVVLEERFVSAKLATVFEGNNLAPPSMDAPGNLWLVDRANGGSTVHLVGRSGRLKRVAAPALRDRVVRSLRVALDGTRVAVVVRDARAGRQLLLGRVVQNGRNVSVQAFRPLEDSLLEVRDVTWMAADALAVLGRDRGSVLQPFQITIAGGVDQLGGSSLQGIRDITAAPGFPLLAARAGAEIWENREVVWRQSQRGRDPAYPG